MTAGKVNGKELVKLATAIVNSDGLTLEMAKSLILPFYSERYSFRGKLSGQLFPQFSLAKNVTGFKKLTFRAIRVFWLPSD